MRVARTREAGKAAREGLSKQLVARLGLLMDADLVRIADVVFSNYDLAKVITAVEDSLGGLMNYLPV